MARVQYLGFLQGKEPEPIPFRKNKDNYHPLVKRFCLISENDYHLQRIFISVLSLGKVFILKPKADLSSILDPFRGSKQGIDRIVTLLKERRP